jgi:transcription-repair coupling factor (superfamily II helicase)
LSALSELIRSLKKGNDLRTIEVTNLPASSDALILAHLSISLEKSLLILTEDAESAERMFDDLARLVEEDTLALFSEGAHSSILAKERQKRTQSAEATAQLLEAMDRLARATGPIITIADAESLTAKLPSRKAFSDDSLTLERGKETGFDALIQWFEAHHFDRKQFVESSGHYAVRGGIVDVFPFTEILPVRIEFFGDVVESMRAFDTISQRSIVDRGSLTLVPNALTENEVIGEATLFDYLSKDALVALIEPERIFSELEVEQTAEMVRTALTPHQLLHVVRFPLDLKTAVDLGFRSQPSFNANLKLIREHTDGLRANGSEVTILTETKDLAKRLGDLLDAAHEDPEAESEHASVITDETDLFATKSGMLRFLQPSLAHGFAYPPEVGAVVYTEHELFGRKRERGASARKKAARTKGISLRELRSLKRGDLLVHEDKGIGKFMGLETIEVRGTKQEVVRLHYRDSDVLFVNLDYIAKLSKYSAGETPDEPKLSKLGSAEWQKTKERTKKRLKDIARNLIQLYAKRKSQEGFAYSPDDIIQREMEAAFVYEDTPDQAKATEDLKRDMESRSPMDRLICGDVGYGKTEVAMRAAMKAVIDKKQAAVLVPTTILAEQHARSFADRLERFGVKVASLSRFRSRKEQTEILKQLEAGVIDVLIGTHRILSKDVIFKDLGLLIIDEEHRFGVAAKEKLREIRTSIDTLTLTATPIPRTLNFSLLGARDMSVMETPPRNRLPISTEVLAGFNEAAITEALKRELARSGQVYAINDKVGDIDAYANKLRELVPRSRVGVVHGQMPPTSIEKVMREFLERKIDILCATKIVESGLDVPNANTIIINRAQNFGLAELYQLRGRVGRSNEQAYCFLVAPPIATLSKDALRRLEAMEEFSELGAGFQLAMRDLEIRGAGNLLGAEQSGFISDIGFELYQKIVDESVEELKREEFQELFKDELAKAKRTAFGRKRLDGSDDVSVSVGVTALIPERYIEDDAERFQFYQRMAKVTTDAEVEEITTELKDRFGPLPEEAANLVHIARIRERAKALGAKSLQFDEPTRSLRILLPPETETHYYQNTFPLILDKFPTVGTNNVRLITEKKQLRLIVRLKPAESDEVRLTEIETLLETLTPTEHSMMEAVAI